MAVQAVRAAGGAPAQLLVQADSTYDVEARGTCLLFAAAGATCMEMVPHAAPAQVARGDDGNIFVQGGLRTVSVPERLCEMWARDQVCVARACPASSLLAPSRLPTCRVSAWLCRLRRLDTRSSRSTLTSHLGCSCTTRASCTRILSVIHPAWCVAGVCALLRAEADSVFSVLQFSCVSDDSRFWSHHGWFHGIFLPNHLKRDHRRQGGVGDRLL